MHVTIEIPDAIADRIQAQWDNLPQKVLEILAVEAYKAKVISQGEVRQMLQIPTRYELDGFLKQAGAYLHYDEADFEADRQTMEKLRQEGKRMSDRRSSFNAG